VAEEEGGSSHNPQPTWQIDHWASLLVELNVQVANLAAGVAADPHLKNGFGIVRFLASALCCSFCCLLVCLFYLFGGFLLEGLCDFFEVECFGHHFVCAFDCVLCLYERESTFDAPQKKNTKMRKIDIVAHSQGTLVARGFIERYGPPVHNFVR
jgi:hypothetical protein